MRSTATQAAIVLLMLESVFVVGVQAGMAENADTGVRENLSTLGEDTVQSCLEDDDDEQPFEEIGVEWEPPQPPEWYQDLPPDEDTVCTEFVGPLVGVTADGAIVSYTAGATAGGWVSWLPNGVSHAISCGLALLVVAQFFGLLLYTASRIPGATGT